MDSNKIYLNLLCRFVCQIDILNIHRGYFARRFSNSAHCRLKTEEEILLSIIYRKDFLKGIDNDYAVSD